jgi:F-type H+-transporting ATPase subunit b
MMRAGLILLALFAPVAAWAAESSGGMPQLDFANPKTLANAVWMLIIFGVLYFLLSSRVLPQAEAVFEARAARLRADLDAAQAAKAEADTAMAEIQARIAATRAEGQAAIAAALQRAQASAQAQSDALAAQLSARIAEAEKRIDASRASALAALPQVATDTAQAILGKLALSVPAPAVTDAVQAEIARRAA